MFNNDLHNSLLCPPRNYVTEFHYPSRASKARLIPELALASAALAFALAAQCQRSH